MNRPNRLMSRGMDMYASVGGLTAWMFPHERMINLGCMAQRPVPLLGSNRVSNPSYVRIASAKGTVISKKDMITGSRQPQTAITAWGEKMRRQRITSPTLPMDTQSRRDGRVLRVVCRRARPDNAPTHQHLRGTKELMAESLRALRPCVSLSYYTQRRRVRREVIVGKFLRVNSKKNPGAFRSFHFSSANHGACRVVSAHAVYSAARWRRRRTDEELRVRCRIRIQACDRSREQLR